MWSAFEGRRVSCGSKVGVTCWPSTTIASPACSSRGAGPRAVIVVHADRVSDSCGYSVPLYEYVGQRTKLDEWAAAKSPEELATYRSAKNAQSIDGLPALVD